MDSGPRLLLLGDARQVHLRRWADYFIASGFEVLTLSLEEPDRFPGEFRHIRVSRKLPDALRYPIAVPVVQRYASEFSPALVNAHYVSNYGMLASMLGRGPWVLSTWGSDVLTDPGRSPFHMWRARRAISRADFITSDADVMTAELVQLGAQRETILTFPYGVDTDVFHPRATPLGDGPRLVTNRKLEPVYSVATVLDAFPGVREAFPGATLAVAGDGSLRTELMRRAERSIGSAAVTFVGGVDHDRMPVLLRENQVYVSASLSDTTSVSLLEAMASGLFPIVSDIPANREWIRHGENGLLVPTGRPMKLAMAIIDGWRDQELVERARRENLRIIRERAVWEDNMRPVRELFETLTAAPA